MHLVKAIEQNETSVCLDLTFEKPVFMIRHSPFDKSSLFIFGVDDETFFPCT